MVEVEEDQVILIRISPQELLIQVVAVAVLLDQMDKIVIMVVNLAVQVLSLLNMIIVKEN